MLLTRAKLFRLKFYDLFIKSLLNDEWMTMKFKIIADADGIDDVDYDDIKDLMDDAINDDDE